MKQQTIQKETRSFLKAAQEGIINRSDAELALDFLDYYGTMQKLTRLSTDKYYFALKAIMREIKLMGSSVEQLTEKEALQLIKYLQTGQSCGDNGHKWSEDTKEDYWKRWCKFYETANDRNGGAWDSKAVLMFTDHRKRYRYRKDKNKIEKKGILTPEEVLQVVDAEVHLEYKVFYAVLYESGMRAGEAFGLRIRDVEKVEGNGYVLHLRVSKTAKRPIPLVHFSTRYLAKWLQQHPQKGNLDAPLFVNTLGMPLENAACNKRLSEVLAVAGINKRKVTLHSFRHSRATELCHILTEAQLCKMFGWSMGSRMPQTYIRAESVDVTKAILKGYGMEKESEKHEIKGRVCLQCGTLNASSAEYCGNCNLPLNPTKIYELNSQVQVMENLLKDYVRKEMASVIEQLKQEYRR